MEKSRSISPNFFAIVLCAVVSFFVHKYELFEIVDNMLLDLRMTAVERHPSGDIVLLAIDSDTIDQVGEWPWPRSIYADILDKVDRLGVRGVAFDIDFSTPSNPEGDRALAEAMARSTTPVVLAAFFQDKNADPNKDGIKYNKPIAELAEHAWLAGVNVLTDEIGLVRAVPKWTSIDDENVPSMAVMLSGKNSVSESGTIQIDFSIDPGRIPRYSLTDLFNDELTDELRDKTVIVGATAAELRDTLAVPAHKVLSGPLIHILAAETFLQNRSILGLPYSVGVVLSLLGIAFLSLLVLNYSYFSRGISFYLCLPLILLPVEGLALALFVFESVNLRTVGIHFTIIIFYSYCFLSLMNIKTVNLIKNYFESRKLMALINNVISNNRDAIIIANGAGVIKFANNRAKELFSFKTEENQVISDVLPNKITQFFHENHVQLIDKIHTESHIKTEIEYTNRSGSEYYFELAITILKVSVEDDISIEKDLFWCFTIRDLTQDRLKQKQIEHLAHFDRVTDVANRNYFVREIHERNWHLAFFSSTIIVVHFSNMTSLAQLYGVKFKNDILKEATDRIVSTFDQSIAGRIQDDAIAFVTPHQSARKISDYERQLSLLFERPIAIGGHQVKVDVRVGAVASWQGFDSGEEYVQAAETVLNEMRENISAGLTLYEITKSIKTHKRLMLEQYLRSALKNDEIKLLFQKQVDLTTRATVGAEALVRWKHKEFGLISPTEFIPIAERNGFINDIGKHVLEKACIEATSWPGNTVISVNVSPIQFNNRDFCDDLRHALAASGLEAERLCLEITETEFLERNKSAIDILHEIKALGVKIAIDDFGTGFSSFEYISRLPIDKIKVDKYFLDEKTISDRNTSVIKSIITLAKGLELEVICEGIEYEEQALLLSSIGCDCGQGYFFGRPEKQLTLDTYDDVKVG